MQGSPMQYWKPNAQYLSDVWLRSREQNNALGFTRQEYQRLRMANITGEYWRADHSFKLLRYRVGMQGAC